MTGFDSSPAMVGLARLRLGEDAALLVADLSEPPPFAGAPLAELRRVLRPGARAASLSAGLR